MANSVGVYAVVIVTMLLMVLGLGVITEVGRSSISEGFGLNKQSALNSVSDRINSVCEGVSNTEEGSVSISGYEITVEDGETELKLKKDGDVEATKQVSCQADSDFEISGSGDYYVTRADNGKFRIAT